LEIIFRKFENFILLFKKLQDRYLSNFRQNVRQKSKCSSKIEMFVKNRNFGKKSKFWAKKKLCKWKKWYFIYKNIFSTKISIFDKLFIYAPWVSTFQKLYLFNNDNGAFLRPFL